MLLDLHAQEELHRIGHVVDIREVPEGTAPGDLLALLFGQPLRHFGIDEPGRYGVHVHPHATHFARQRPREANQRRFGRAVNRKTAVAGESKNRRDVHDPSAAISQHGAHHVLGQDHRRERVQPHQFFDARVRHQRQSAIEADTGVVHQSVNGSEFLAHGFHEPGDFFDFRQVERNEANGSGADFRLSRRRSQHIGFAARDRNDLIAFARQLTGDTQAQTPISAGYDDVAHGWRDDLTGGGHFEAADEADRRRHFVAGKCRAAELQDLLLGLLRLPVQGVWRRRQHDIGDNQRTRQRVLSCSYKTHLDAWVPVDHRLHLFRMNLQAAHVDDTIPPADEIVAALPQFEHVAGVDEAVRIRQNPSVWTDVARRGTR